MSRLRGTNRFASRVAHSLLNGDVFSPSVRRRTAQVAPRERASRSQGPPLTPTLSPADGGEGDWLLRSQVRQRCFSLSEEWRALLA